MLEHITSELRSSIAETEENEKISSEYRNSCIRLFLSVAEAGEILEIIEGDTVGRCKVPA
ncbi:MAG: hypothetical protein ACLFVT_02435 [Syntrophobacteria bacterium]